MAKLSKTKRQNPNAALQSRTPKTRVNKTQKDILLASMKDQYESRLDGSVIAINLDELLQGTNAILRARYPEADMVIVRKHKLARIDKCLKFSRTETERMFYIQFEQTPDIEQRLADIACYGGCYNNEVFPCDAAFEELADRREKLVAERSKLISDKVSQYHGFIEACRYLEEVEAVVPLTEEIRNKLGAQSRSLTVISPEVLSGIKADFAQGVAV
jgi:hypothetical protein